MKLAIKYKSEAGFALYYAVLFSSVLLAVGVSMLNISLKEFLLSASLKESETAFFAADSGAECAIYWDIRQVGIFPVYRDSGSVLRTAPSPPFPGTVADPSPIRCNGTDTVTPTVTTATLTAAMTTLTFNVNGSFCTFVQVSKLIRGDGSVSTTIDARGYNATCASASTRRVERALTYTY